jgi:alkylhydroperoxidase family enzyme
VSRLPLVEEQELSGFAKDLHEGAAESDWSTRHVARVFAAHPGLLEDYLGFYYPWHSSAAEASLLPPRIKELVRLRIAVLNGCQTCMAARLAADAVPEPQATGVWEDGYDTDEAYTAAEQAAMRFAERLAVAHHGIGDEDIAELRRHFSEAETLELMMMAGQYIGFGRVLAVLQLETTSCPIP